ncbi:MAG TPA: hypothetical protein VGG06_20725 [Thermoanaerobaculia bacterium]|jgi:hypothetical protein
MHRATSTALCALGLLAATPAAPQAVVSALARGPEPLTTTTDVHCSRFASFEDEPEVVAGMELEPGDLLASVTADVDLELTCPNGSLLRFTGGFRVMVEAAAGDACAVNFLSGTLDVLTDKETEVHAGGVVLGSEGTQYSVSLSREGTGTDWKCWVYDGRVRWTTPEVDDRWLGAGTRLRLADRQHDAGVTVETRITEQELTHAALRYATFDVARSRTGRGQVEDPRAAVEELSKLHFEVLARPDDSGRRVELAKKQLALRIPSQAAYNLGRAGVRTEQELRRYQIDASSLRVPQPPVPPPRELVRVTDPVALVQTGSRDQAMAQAKKKVEAGTADSRDYYALALAYRELDGAASERAATAAKRALRLHRADGKLLEKDIASCKRLAAGG